MSTLFRRRGPKRVVRELRIDSGYWSRFWHRWKHGFKTSRVLLVLVSSIAIWLCLAGWQSRMTYRVGDVPQRDITARIDFQVPNELDTAAARVRAEDNALLVYSHDPAPFIQLRQNLLIQLEQLATVATYASLIDSPEGAIWKQFNPASSPQDGVAAVESGEEEFEKFRSNFNTREKRTALSLRLEEALQPFERRGLLRTLPAEPGSRNLIELEVYLKGRPESAKKFKFAEVLLGDGEELRAFVTKVLNAPDVSKFVVPWILARLPESTLVLDPARTEQNRTQARESTPIVFTRYAKGDALAKSGTAIDQATWQLLSHEHLAVQEQERTEHPPWRTGRGIGSLVFIGIICALGVTYAVWCAPRIVRSWRRSVTLLLFSLFTLLCARWTSLDPWRAELMPFLLFGMVIAIIDHREEAIVFTLGLILIYVLCMGQGLSELIVLGASVTVAVMQLDSIRGRKKLIWLGFVTAAFSAGLTFLAGLYEGKILSQDFLQHCAQNGLWTFLVGFLVTGLLPFLESSFGVLTDISLLELGDIAHPLLQELVRRAPGTYNHSINVASLGEAAAESIHARGLLVRVGAYFHDVGKMLKPEYYVENVGTDSSRHDHLAPAMSTLVIISHIKDGAELARRHHLPQPIIDLINQHHGTTLVEYFFRRAQETAVGQREKETLETSFRYPGPKPQSKEAAVLMLADAMESACRTLVGPTPGRIESLMENIARKRLLDGQFDECGLTLSELRQVQDSLVKTLNAIYHGRIQYPDQQTA